jgi:hypothetical protein
MVLYTVQLLVFDALMLRVSVANHDPDFDLAKGSRQVAISLRIDSNDLGKEITDTILNLRRISRRIRKNSNE